MQNNEMRNPQVASILHNLARLSGNRTTAQNLASEGLPGQRHVLQHHDAPASHQPRSASMRADRGRPPASKPDASRITEWPAGARFVMNHVSQSPELSAKIKRLIKNQHDNEKQWWAGREALLTKHRERAEGEKKVEDILKSLGRSSSENDHQTLPSTSDSQQTELESYDKKVYAALGQMVMAMDKELTALSIPFFALRHDLVQDHSDASSGTVSKGEVSRMQKRMLELLQDLFGE